MHRAIRANYTLSPSIYVKKAGLVLAQCVVAAVEQVRAGSKGMIP
jgi:hypothetical protein